MRDNSGGGKSSNNSGNPALRDHEREKGVSGSAALGEKGTHPEPSRTSPRKHLQS